MNRTLVVATTEFLALVKTKAFIIGLIMMPVLVGISIGVQVFAAKHTDKEDHLFAVIDQTGVLYDSLAAAAKAHNVKSGPDSARTGPYFIPSKIDPGARSLADVEIDLSAQVKSKALFGFIIIPPNILDLDSTTSTAITYYTNTPSYDALPDWIEESLNHEIATRRFAKASVDPALVAKLTRRADVSTLGLVERNPDGSVREAKEVDKFATFLVPFGMMYLLFIALMSSAPALLNAVIEEKMSKISEVLVASISPMQLMMGKLAGVSGVSVLLAIVYLGGALYAAGATGHLDAIHPALLGWFVVYLFCAVLMFGSVFIAIGSACSDLKDAQSMMQPAMILLLLPLFVAPVILRDPSSPFAVGASLFPTASPFIMLMRLAMTPEPPIWQVGLSLVLTIGATIGIVWAASRIFRVGLLMQGKAPSLREMLRWVNA
ncbi:MAG TPA: ABC transporter permease [Gemmatimonadaceae bacterium]|nr:ABC transporter permease [Gemmatimonadaceae bacterium]